MLVHVDLQICWKMCMLKSSLLKKVYVDLEYVELIVCWKNVCWKMCRSSPCVGRTQPLRGSQQTSIKHFKHHRLEDSVILKSGCLEPKASYYWPFLSTVSSLLGKSIASQKLKLPVNNSTENLGSNLMSRKFKWWTNLLF